MCGIFGILQAEQSSFDHLEPSNFFDYRGPDDRGWLLADNTEVIIHKGPISPKSANVFLLHKRLAIQDLSHLGAQPMVCQSNRYYLIFNGEIYNYLELKNELLAKGYKFSSTSDSEVLLKAYIQWGANCLTKLIGMFAFAIYDHVAKRIFFARDNFGIKPLYYVLQNKRIIFSSEMRTLLPWVDRQLNANALFHYLRSGLTDYSDETMVNGIAQLPAGHYAEYDCINSRFIGPTLFWQPTINPSVMSFPDAAKFMREKFLHNIDLHLRSDVQVAATLSGGIDSSAIVGAVHYLKPQLKMNTYSYIASDPNLTEESWVDVVTRATNANSYKVFANANNLINDVSELITLQDEPFGSSSIYAQQQIFKAAANNGIKVMLDGQGADEILGGYHFYFAARLISALKSGNFLLMSQLLWQARSSINKNTMLRSFYYLLPYKFQKPFYKLANISYLPNWLNYDWFKQFNLHFQPLKTHYGKQVLHEELIHTLSKSSLPMLLRYVDRNSMAYSIESRVPFLTPDFVEFALSLPEKFIISNTGVTKSVFREAMRGIVPQAILDRRDKIGFATPEKHWLLEAKDWVSSIIDSDYARSLPFLKHEAMKSQWQQMISGETAFDLRYWRWLNFIKWSEINQIKTL